MTRLEKARAWAADHMRPGQFIDGCHWVRSGYAIWNPREGHHASHCTCREVPKSYALLLGAPKHEELWS